MCAGGDQMCLKYPIVCADGLLLRVKALNMCPDRFPEQCIA
jgi:hypothetical protein